MTTKQPEDHQSSTFTYHFESGKSVTLPRWASVMTFGLARKLRRLPESDQTFAMVEEVCSDEVLAILDEMSQPEAEAFFEAWQEDSGATMGESSA